MPTMRANLAQITGVAVTSIVTLGADVDVLYAVPLGVFAGALAIGFVAAAEARPKQIVPLWKRLRAWRGDPPGVT
jgi:hypothetical protein